MVQAWVSSAPLVGQIPPRTGMGSSSLVLFSLYKVRKVENERETVGQKLVPAVPWKLPQEHESGSTGQASGLS